MTDIWFSGEGGAICQRYYTVSDSGPSLLTALQIIENGRFSGLKMNWDKSPDSPHGYVPSVMRPGQFAPSQLVPFKHFGNSDLLVHG